MGLRIIDRQAGQVPQEITQIDRDLGLIRTTTHWAGAKGTTNLDIQAHFIDNFRRAKARISSEAQVLALAAGLKDAVRGQLALSQGPHGPVDVATLMVLL